MAATRLPQAAAAAARLVPALRGATTSLPPPASTRGRVEVAARHRPLLSWPVPGPVTSRFGPRWSKMHSGIDIGASVGTPVQAAASGRVTRVAWIGGYGYTVEIDHGGGCTTFYAHLSRVLVRGGEEVERGQPIGSVGETGRVTGPHLHFELRLDGEPTDPLPLLGS